MISHNYLSTACTHGIHGRCRFTCKFCHEVCVCQCHAEQAEASRKEVEEAFQRLNRVQPGDVGTKTINTTYTGEQAWKP